GFEALLKLGKDIDALAKQLIDIKTGETLMETKYATIGSRIKHNTNSSREFLELVPTLSNYLGYVQEKELLNATSLEGKNIAEFAKDKNIYRKNKDFFESTFTLYNKIIDTAQE
ncbi:TPA: ParA family protein, partial [Enterococcus faecium]|nr:ParA family protein [Enterococcus faecium]HCR9808075.1 ParA family protein [Enterococcus faecium]